jgi:ParB family chromosome partitioning protein
VRADDWRARFVTIAAYAAAGGAVITDLFGKDGDSYLTDPALLDRIVATRCIHSRCCNRW